MILKLIIALFPYRIATRSYNEGYHAAYLDMHKRLERMHLSNVKNLCKKFESQFETETFDLDPAEHVRHVEGMSVVGFNKLQSTVFYAKAVGTSSVIHPPRGGYATWNNIGEKLIESRIKK